MSVAAGEEGGKLAADADAGQSDVASRAKHGTMSVAACEEDGLLAVNDHWEVEQRAHEAGAEMPRRSHAIATITVVKISNVMSTLMWTTGRRQRTQSLQWA